MYQIGACCIYVVFISTNIKELTDYFFETNTDVRLFMLMILLPLILINWVCSALMHQKWKVNDFYCRLLQIRNLKYLAPFSTIGNFVTLATLAIIFYYIFREPFTMEGKVAVGPVSNYPMFFGTVLFAMEAIGVIMPLENEMKSPKNFVGPTGVLNKAMCLIVSLYIGLGLTGYLRYGEATRSSITLNLPDHELYESWIEMDFSQFCQINFCFFSNRPSQILKAMISCGVFFTHAVACYVAIDLAWNEYVLKRIAHSAHKLRWEYTMRAGIVFITCKQ